MRAMRVSCALCGARGSVLNKRAIKLPKGLVYICGQDFITIIASADLRTLEEARILRTINGDASLTIHKYERTGDL